MGAFQGLIDALLEFGLRLPAAGGHRSGDRFLDDLSRTRRANHAGRRGRLNPAVHDANPNALHSVLSRICHPVLSDGRGTRCRP